MAAATTLPEAVIRQDDRGLEFSLPRKPCSSTEFVCVMIAINRVYGAIVVLL